MRLLVLFSSVLWLGSASAQEPAIQCAGANLFERLRVENPALDAEIDRDLSGVENSEGLFFRIERTGVRPSFLFGTIHVSDPRVLSVLKRIEPEVRNVRTLALEIADLKKKAADATLVMRKAFGSQLGTVSRIKDERIRAAVRNALAERSLPESLHDNLKPWFIAMLIALPQCEMLRQAQVGRVLDEQLESMLTDLGAGKVSLETFEEQIEAFAGMSEAVLQEMIEQLASAGPQARVDIFETMIQSYLGGNVSRLMVAARKQRALLDQEMTGMAEFQTQLIDKRNLTMRDRSLPLLEKGNALIAVGALHLPGTTGLVRLFREEGYTVTKLW